MNFINKENIQNYIFCKVISGTSFLEYVCITRVTISTKILVLVAETFNRCQSIRKVFIFNTFHDTSFDASYLPQTLRNSWRHTKIGFISKKPALRSSVSGLKSGEDHFSRKIFGASVWEKSEVEATLAYDTIATICLSCFLEQT